MKILSSFLLGFSFLVFALPLFAQQSHELYSSNVPYMDTIKVFYPKTYTTTKTYPIVIMLHGWSANQDQWANITNLQTYADRYGWLIACPNGFYDSWYMDSPELASSQYETYFFENLMPFLQRKYKIDPKNIFITGLSMGGQGALRLYLKDPDFFNSAGSTSGVFDLKVVGNRLGLDRLLGAQEEFADRWQAFSVMGRLETLQDTPKTFIFDCGRKDPFFKNNEEMNALCQKMGIKAVFVPQDGDHSKTYWAKSIQTHFDFFKKQLK